jgi:hypothetical protein
VAAVDRRSGVRRCRRPRGNICTVCPRHRAALKEEAGVVVRSFRGSNTGPVSQSEKSTVLSTPSLNITRILNPPRYSASTTSGKIYSSSLQRGAIRSNDTSAEPHRTGFARREPNSAAVWRRPPAPRSALKRLVGRSSAKAPHSTSELLRTARGSLYSSSPRGHTASVAKLRLRQPNRCPGHRRKTRHFAH